MAESTRLTATPEIRAQWGNFAWTAENAEKVATIIARYPPGRQHSAIIPLLDLAQRQIGVETNTQGWLPIPVIEIVGAQLGMPFIRAYEVATSTPCSISHPSDATTSRCAARRPACCAARTTCSPPATPRA
jgi:NADH-quinone oxidoreductase subunit E